MTQFTITAPIIPIMKKRKTNLKKTAIMSALYTLTAVVFLSGLSVFLLKSPTDKASEYMAMASYIDNQMVSKSYSAIDISNLNNQKQELLKQAWQLNPYHPDFINTYTAFDATKVVQNNNLTAAR